MRVERITPETTRGKGWARVTFKDCAKPSDLASMAVMRPRHMEPFLGPMGWQVAESRLPLNIEIMGESDFALLLPPSVVQHLEVASNYEYCFFDRTVKPVEKVVVRWSGVSYRAPGGTVSPIEIIEPSGRIPLSGIADELSLEGDRNDKPFDTEKGASSAIEGFGPAWGGGLSGTEFPLPHDDSPGLKENLFIPNMPPPESPQPRQALTGSYDRKVVRRIRCRNPNCGCEIFDSMKKCTFCNTPV